MVFALGTLFLALFMLFLADINTRYCTPVPADGAIDLNKFRLYSLDSAMKETSQLHKNELQGIASANDIHSLRELEAEISLPASAFDSEPSQFPRLYIPDSRQSLLSVNGQIFTAETGREYIILNLSDCPYVLENNSVKFTVRLFLLEGDDASFSNVLVYLGSYSTINRLISAGSFQRFFVIGMSFMVLLYSLSLYYGKSSEKYLLFLALLAYTTSARTLWNALPALKNLLIPNLLLLGTITLPGLSYGTSYYLSYIVLKYIIACTRFMILREFISMRISRKSYLIFCGLFAAAMMPFCFFGMGYPAAQAFILGTHLVEFVMLIAGSRNHLIICLTITAAWGMTVGLRIYDMLCTFSFVPHGMIEACLKMQGIVETFMMLAFVVVINLKFAHKYSEADTLTASLEIINENLESIVRSRTEDLTQSNIRLTEAYKQLNDIQRQKDEFMQNIIHSLKTPLFSLYGYADMAMDELEDAPELARKHLEEINKNTAYARQLIDDLFLCMRLEDGKIKYNPMPFSVRLLLSQLDSTSSPKAAASGVQLMVEQVDENMYITADMLYIRQALQNIIDNAIRHSPPESCISISAKPVEHEGRKLLSICIEDHGDGIADDELPLIFARHYSKGKKGASSSGLGLTITKEIIQQHGGFIEVSSRLTEGSVFNVYLPV